MRKTLTHRNRPGINTLQNQIFRPSFLASRRRNEGRNPAPITHEGGAGSHGPCGAGAPPVPRPRRPARRAPGGERHTAPRSVGRPGPLDSHTPASRTPQDGRMKCYRAACRHGKAQMRPTSAVNAAVGKHAGRFAGIERRRGLARATRRTPKGVRQGCHARRRRLNAPGVPRPAARRRHDDVAMPEKYQPRPELAGTWPRSGNQVPAVAAQPDTFRANEPSAPPPFPGACLRADSGEPAIGLSSRLLAEPGSGALDAPGYPGTSRTPLCL